ncbi:MAG: hypothetical protein JWP92_2025 [Caulobacter sp.]|nr:hypothetical protein [Caulobacter sp.]
MSPIDSSPDPDLPPTLSQDKTMAMVIYILYLVGLTNGLTAIIGLVLAYVSKRDAPAWLQSHYVFQIRTFWISLLFAAIGCLLLVIGVGVLILAAVGVWIAVRCVLGLMSLIRGEAYPNPQSWMI